RPPVPTLFPYTTLFRSRTDNGDVAPRSIISGPKTGLGVVRGTRKVIFSPQGKKIIATGRRGGAASGELFIADAKPFIGIWNYGRSEEHTSELQSRFDLV